ncbi:NAD-dependent epimerase/dehydratase family protein [Flavobacteriaceae bacterium 3-367]
MKKTDKIYVAGHHGRAGSAILKVLWAKGYVNIVTRSHRELNLKDSRATASFFKMEKPDYVFLAAEKVGSRLMHTKQRADVLYENLMIQNNVIGQSQYHNVKKLLFLGSPCVYPKSAPWPVKEKSLLTDALDYTHEPYALAKIAGIKMCEGYNIQYGTNFISVVPAHFYGPSDDFNLETSHPLPKLIRKIYLGKALENDDWEAIRTDLNKRPIKGITGKANKGEIAHIIGRFGVRRIDNKKVMVEVGGNGKTRGEFLWSGDMADACIFLMKNEYVNGAINVTPSSGSRSYLEAASNKMRNTPINIGTGKEISIAQLAKTIKVVLRFKGILAFNDCPLDGELRRLADNTKLNNLGWKPRVSLKEGIEQLYRWYILKS